MTSLDTLRSGCQKPLVLQLGCGKAGTVSLRRALDTLGYRAVHDHTGVCASVARNLLRGRVPEAFGEYDAFCDVPRRLEVMQNLQLPTSVDWRVIFTTRHDVESWITSYMIHVLHNRVCRPHEPFVEISTHELRRWYEDMHQTADLFDQRYPGRMLRFDVSAGDGWSELCGFLGDPVPSDEFPGLHGGNDKLREILEHRGGV